MTTTVNTRDNNNKKDRKDEDLGEQILQETDDLMEEINETWGRNRDTGTQEKEEPIQREPRYRCEHCKTKFNTMPQMKQHMEKELQEKVRQYIREKDNTKKHREESTQETDTTEKEKNNGDSQGKEKYKWRKRELNE